MNTITNYMTLLVASKENPNSEKYIDESITISNTIKKIMIFQWLEPQVQYLEYF